MIVDSNIFEVMDYTSQIQLITFLDMNAQLTEGQFIFKDPNQKVQFEKFQNALLTLNNSFPVFKLKLKRKKLQESQSQQTEQERNDQSIQTMQLQQGISHQYQANTSSEFQIEQESEILSSLQDNSQINRNNQTVNYSEFQDVGKLQPSVCAPQSQIQQSNVSTGDYQDNQSLRDNDSILDSASRSLSSNRDHFDGEAAEKRTASLEQPVLQPILYQDMSVRKEEERELDADKFEQYIQSLEDKNESFILNTQPKGEIDNQITLQGLSTNQAIQLKDGFIITMIDQFYQTEWNKLIQNLTLKKISLRTYKFTFREDFQQTKIQMQAFFNTIHYLQLDFCYHTNQTLLAQSSMNAFLMSQNVNVYEVQDKCFLVSIQNSVEQLKELSSQINDNYRGMLLYFNNLKSTKPLSYQNQDLQILRREFYKQYLSTEISKYSFNQFSNEQFFLFEMNFSKISQNKDFTNKTIKKYIESFLQNLIMLKFRYEQTISQNSDQDPVFQFFQQAQAETKTMVILLRQDDYILILGMSQHIAEIINQIQQQIKIQRNQNLHFRIFEIKLNKQNFLYQILENQLVDFDAARDLIIGQGVIVEEQSTEITFKIENSSKCTLKSLLTILRFWCDVHRQNNNKAEIENLFKQFKSQIQEKQLNAELDFLKNIQECLQINSVKVNINIQPSRMQNFSKKDYVQLECPYLDIIINENFAEEFAEKFSKFNCLFEKVGEGVYQLQSFDSAIATKFNEYFKQFYVEEIIRDEQSLSTFEQSMYLKKLLKNQQVYYLVVNRKLSLISKTKAKILTIQEWLQLMKGQVIYMANLKNTYENVRPEYFNLVSARIGFMKCFLSPLLKSASPVIAEIEHIQEQEITASIIVHLNFNVQNTKYTQKDQDQLQIQVFELVQQLYHYKYIEITTSKESVKLFQQISKCQQQLVYVSQRTNSADSFITLLAHKDALIQISKDIDYTSFSDETLKNMEFNIYIEQFYPFRTLVQDIEDRRKFKRELERKGFQVNDNLIKWTIKSLNSPNIFSLLAILAEKSNSVQLMQLLPTHYTSQEKPAEPLDMTSILQRSSFFSNRSQDQSAIQLIQQLQPNNTNSLIENHQVLIQTLQISGQKQKETIQLVEQNKQSQQSSQISLENSKSATESQQVFSQLPSQIQQRSDLTDLEINKSATQSQAIFSFAKSEVFKKECLLAQFIQERKVIQSSNKDPIINQLSIKEPYTFIECFEPKIDREYEEYFRLLTQNKTTDLYFVIKPEKQFINEFSKKILFHKLLDTAIAKFLKHQTSILVLVKANSSAKYWVPDPANPDLICLKESQQIKPHLCYQRKKIL